MISQSSPAILSLIIPFHSHNKRSHIYNSLSPSSKALSYLFQKSEEVESIGKLWEFCLVHTESIYVIKATLLIAIKLTRELNDADIVH